VKKRFTDERQRGRERALDSEIQDASVKEMPILDGDTIGQIVANHIKVAHAEEGTVSIDTDKGKRTIRTVTD